MLYSFTRWNPADAKLAASYQAYGITNDTADSKIVINTAGRYMFIIEGAYAVTNIRTMYLTKNYDTDIATTRSGHTVVRSQTCAAGDVFHMWSEEVDEHNAYVFVFRLY